MRNVRRRPYPKKTAIFASHGGTRRERFRIPLSFAAIRVRVVFAFRVVGPREPRDKSQTRDIFTARCFRFLFKCPFLIRGRSGHIRTARQCDGVQRATIAFFSAHRTPRTDVQ